MFLMFMFQKHRNRSKKQNNEQPLCIHYVLDPCSSWLKMWAHLTPNKHTSHFRPGCSCYISCIMDEFESSQGMEVMHIQLDPEHWPDHWWEGPCLFSDPIQDHSICAIATLTNYGCTNNRHYVTDYIPNWWIWGYWMSPLTYAYNAIAINEMLAPRWMNRLVLPLSWQMIVIVLCSGLGMGLLAQLGHHGRKHYSPVGPPWPVRWDSWSYSWFRVCW